jgi:DNA-binding GntR family transcriptional regulator
VRRTALDQHLGLARAVMDGVPEVAAEVAGHHFTLSENLIRELVARVRDEATS